MSGSLDALLVSADESRAKTWTHQLWQVGSLVNTRRVDNLGEMLSSVLTKSWDVILLADDCGTLRPEIVFECLRETSASIPVILMVSDVDALEAVRLMSMGASDLIPKTDEHRLPAAVRRVRLLEDHRQITNGVAESSALATEIFRAVAEGIFVIGRNMSFRTVNPATTRITGYAPEELIGQDLSKFVVSDQADQIMGDVWLGIERDGLWKGEIECQHKSGEVFTAWFNVTAIRDGGGEIVEAVGILSDITERKKEADRIWRQANFDHLTGLANRACFFDRFSVAISAALEKHHHLALIYVDLDFFKSVNDTLGHAAGDQLLQQAAKRMQSCLREEDFLARLGGDEFAILVAAEDVEAPARVIADKLVRQLVRPFEILGREAYVSASIGIAICPDQGDEADDLLTKADRAMYRAKQGGRNRFYCFDPALDDLDSGLHVGAARGQTRPSANSDRSFAPTAQTDDEPGMRSSGWSWGEARRGRPHWMAPAGFIGLSIAVIVGAWVFFNTAFFDADTNNFVAEPDQPGLNEFAPAAGSADAEDNDTFVPIEELERLSNPD